MSRCLLKAFPGTQREKQGQEGRRISHLLSPFHPSLVARWMALPNEFQVPSTAPSLVSFLRAEEVVFGKKQVPFPTAEYLLSKKCGQARQVHGSTDLPHSAHNFGGHGRRSRRQLVPREMPPLRSRPSCPRVRRHHRRGNCSTYYTAWPRPLGLHRCVI